MTKWQNEALKVLREAKHLKALADREGYVATFAVAGEEEDPRTPSTRLVPEPGHTYWLRHKDEPQSSARSFATFDAAKAYLDEIARGRNGEN